MLVVNLYGGPGSGKSTMAADLFQALKREGVNCELVTEWCKDKVWEGNKKIFQDQIYIFGKQHWKQLRMKGEVDVIITDSPLLLSLVYNDMNTGEGYLEELEPLVLEAFHKFNNLNVFVNRDKPYNPKGRNQTEEEAKDVDIRIRGMLKFHDIPHINVNGTSRAEDGLLAVVKSHLALPAPLLVGDEGKILPSTLPSWKPFPEYLEPKVTPVTFSTNLISRPPVDSEGEFKRQLGEVLEQFNNAKWDEVTREAVRLTVYGFCRGAFDYAPSNEGTWTVEWIDREYKVGQLTLPEQVLRIWTSALSASLPGWAREMDPITIAFKKR